MLFSQKPFAVEEFQAVILAGYGNRLYPLTQSLPKALLPVANKPLIYYPLQWLDQAKVNDIIITCYPSARKDITHYVHKVYEANTRILVVEVAENCGTADALRAIKNKIQVL